MTTQFHEGQDVEVRKQVMLRDPAGTVREWWEPAKIVSHIYDSVASKMPGGFYRVQFPDGSRAVFDAEHIRAKGVIIVDPTTGYAGD